MGRLRLGALQWRINAVVPMLLALLALGGTMAPPSNAASASPHWSIIMESQPTYFKPGDTNDAYALIVRNDGGAPTTSASPVTVTDELPEHVTATKVTAKGEAAYGNDSLSYEMKCPKGPIVGSVTCTYEADSEHVQVSAGSIIVVTITVSVEGSALSPLKSSATVAGGGAPSASASETTPLDAAPIPFGVSFFDVEGVWEDGEADIQAGSHPYELITSLGFNADARELPSIQNGNKESPLSDFSTKTIEVALPPGLIGNPNAVPRCSQQAFLRTGTAQLPPRHRGWDGEPAFYGTFHSAVYPVFNIEPPAGQPGEAWLLRWKHRAHPAVLPRTQQR